jgi:hypothetical protein
LPASSAAAAAAAAEVEGKRGGEGRGEGREALGRLRPADPNEKQPRRNATMPAPREALAGAPLFVPLLLRPGAGRGELVFELRVELVMRAAVGVGCDAGHGRPRGRDPYRPMRTNETRRGEARIASRRFSLCAAPVPASRLLRLCFFLSLPFHCCLSTRNSYVIRLGFSATVI